MTPSNVLRIAVVALIIAFCQAFRSPLLAFARPIAGRFHYKSPSRDRSETIALSASNNFNLGGGKGFRKKKLKTFVRYLEVECWKRAELRELEPVFQAVAEACKQISRIVQRAKTDDLYGVALGADGAPLDSTNIQGEVQQKLDVICNTFMLRAFCGCSTAIHSVASEEEDEPRCCADIMVCCM
jgi:Fructose-1-6-bisphosphatase, N-terminal domain